MLLTITTTHVPATDLGFLLHKHPGRMQSFAQSVGVAHVFYPESTEARCTAALLLEVDPVGLVRGRTGKPGEGFALGHYVNDRPYAASSLLAVALKDVFRTALTGRCNARPELAGTPIPLEVHVPAVACRPGPELSRRLFEPLGWRVEATTGPLDPAFPAWGDSPYVDLRLTGDLRLADALNHLYVLLPALDEAKHHYVGQAEVDKLLRAGSGWLAGHPESGLIARRYLPHRRELARSALARLAEVDDLAEEQLDNAVVGSADDLGRPDLPVPSDPRDPTGPQARPEAPESPVPPVPPVPPEPPVPLAEQRRGAVLAVLRGCGARRVVDLGCGEGELVRDLLAEPGIERVLAVDVSVRALRIAGRRLGLDRMTEPARERVALFQSSLIYRDERLAGLDAAVLMEVIEHVDPDRLAALEAAVFGFAAPGTVIVTTPNVEHNVRYETLPAGAMRHRDHRFEWNRAEFHAWSARVAATHGYLVRHLPVGVDDPEVGPPTQLAIFSRSAARKGATT